MTVQREYTEGSTTFLSADVDHYSQEKGQPTTSMPVFYNPRMRLNRDISVLMLSAYLTETPLKNICEPLTGSGVRTLRYLNECEGDFKAKMFDANPQAIEFAKRNLERLALTDRAETRVGDAKVLLLTESRESRFDFVDIDPFGSPAPYLNAAVQSLDPNGGLLAATATDMPALCGVYPKVSLRKYGGVSIRAPFVHEIAVRLLLGHVYRVAGSNDRAMAPLAVLSRDHYIRIWARIVADRRLSNRQTTNLGMIQYCPKCMRSISVPIGASVKEFEHASDCDGKRQEAGPLWIGKLYEPKFLDAATGILQKLNLSIYHRKMADIVERITDEQALTGKTFIDLHALCDLHNITAPKNVDVIDGLHEAGHSATRTHFSTTAIRTDAPADVVAEIVKTIVSSR